MPWNPSIETAPSYRLAVHTARDHWENEQDYRGLKDKPGLDHFEGKGWIGWHPHVTLLSLTICFLRSEQRRTKRRFWYKHADDDEVPLSKSHSDSGPMSVLSKKVRRHI